MSQLGYSAELSVVRSAPLGELIFESSERNVDGTCTEVRSVTNSLGLVRTSDFFENARTSSDTRNYKIVRPGMFVYNPSRVNVGSIGYLDEPDPVIVSPMYVVFGLDAAYLDVGYLALFLESATGRRQIESKTEVGARFRLTYDSMSTVRIPLPSLSWQREIVRRLGAFRSLERELVAELNARFSQYTYYRDSLLTRDAANHELRTLREVSLDFGRGKSKHRPRNDPALYGGPYPFIQTGDVKSGGHLITSYTQTYSERGLAQSKLWPKGTICITIAANIAETGILDFDACFPDSVIGMVVDPQKASRHYVEYLLQSIKAGLAAKGRGSAQANINLATFESARFPFPSLDEQERIVSALDRFDRLANDSSSGINAELRARRRQFEYYRDRLLSFEEAVA